MALPFHPVSTKIDISSTPPSVYVSADNPMPVTNSGAVNIPLGNVAGYTSVNKFGRTTNADNGVATDVWDGANATDDQPIWLAPTAARVHAIVSTSANDTSAGSGAQTVQVYGLTSWDTAESSEVVTLNGVTPVNTLSSYVIIHRMRVVTDGGTNINEGAISATAATDGTLTAQINADEGQTQMTIYGVPSTQTAVMTQFYASILKASATVRTNIELKSNTTPGDTPTTFTIKHSLGLTTTGTSTMTHRYDPYKTFTGPCIIKIQTTSTANDTDVNAGFDLILVDN